MLREPRYIVFKIKDVLKFLDQGEIDLLQAIGQKLAGARAQEGRACFNAVVVEQDWLEFDMVWDLLDKRVQQESKEEHF